MFESREDKISRVFLKAQTSQPTNQLKNSYLLFFFLNLKQFVRHCIVYIFIEKAGDTVFTILHPIWMVILALFIFLTSRFYLKAKIKSWKIWSDCFHTWTCHIPGDKFYITAYCWYYYISLALYKIFDIK